MCNIIWSERVGDIIVEYVQRLEETVAQKSGSFVTIEGRVVFIGGPGSGGGSGKGSTTTRSLDNLPSEDNLIPDAILEQVPLGTFENCASGCAMANYPPSDMLEQYRAPNPYAAMRWYGNETYWGTPRHPERILGDTPITRFFFKFADGGEKVYEVLYNEGEQLFYIAPFAPSSEFFRPVAKPKRGTTRVPLWSDFVPFDVKEGRFITKDNRVIFIGGPGAGGGRASSEAVSNAARLNNYYEAPDLDEDLVKQLQEIGPWEPTSAAEELGITTWNTFSKDTRRWVQGAEQEAKEDISQWLHQDPQLRTLSLYGIWSSAANKGDDSTFEQWLDTPQTLYRGGRISYPFMSFAFNDRVARDASGSQSVWQVTATPRQWLGASQSGAGEVWIETEAFEYLPPAT